jgi:hypothetical protein
MSERVNPEMDNKVLDSLEGDPLEELARIVAGEDVDPPHTEDTSVEAEAPQPIEVAEPMDEDFNFEQALLDEMDATQIETAEADLVHPAQEISEVLEQVDEPALENLEEVGASDLEINFEDDLESMLQNEMEAEVSVAEVQQVIPEAESDISELEATLDADMERELASELSAQTDLIADETPVLAEPQVAEQVVDEDLGAAFDNEFQQILDNERAAIEQVDQEFAPENTDAPEEVAEYIVENAADSIESFETQTIAEPQDLDFGSAFAEELGLEQVGEVSGWNEADTIAAQGEFNSAVQYEAEPTISDDPGHADAISGMEMAAGATGEEQKGGSMKYAIAAMFIALVAGSIVAGYGFLGGGDSNVASGDPQIIKADSDPVKVKPDDPGGRVVANQDKATFSEDGSAPSDQETLISNTEEPADILAPGVTPITEDTGVVDTNLPEKSGDRLASTDGAETNAGGNSQDVTPRVVQTVVVKPDGTIITQPLAPAPSTNVVEQAAQTLALNQTSEINPVVAPVKPVATELVKLKEPIDGASTSGSLAVPEASPVPKPVAAPAPKVKPKPVQVAASQPEPASPAVAKSQWVVQVSSQRSTEAAQASFQNLRNRFGALQNRAMSIQRANVNGSTFYRVRVQTSSKSDANQLCSSLKSSGGSCFVTR